MNPNTATLRSKDIQQILDCSAQSVYRYFGRGAYPAHYRPTKAPMGRTYAIPEVAKALRDNRSGGLAGAELASLVAFDTVTRAARDDDYLWLGFNAFERGRTFSNTLDVNEADRAHIVTKTFRNALAACGLSNIHHLSKSVLIAPAVVRYILTNDAEELPVGDAGWSSFCRAAWVTNPSPETIEKVA